MKRTIIKYFKNGKKRKKTIEIPKELRKYYTQDIEELRDENPISPDIFTKYVLLLHRHKELTAKEVIMAIEHYNMDFDGENPHGECICEAIGREVTWCPDSAH